MNLDDNTSLEIIIQIREALAKLSTQVEQVLNITSNHEQRLMRLEENKNKGSLKDDILAWAIRGLVISICALGTLAGAGSIIAKVAGAPAVPTHVVETVK